MIIVFKFIKKYAFIIIIILAAASLGIFKFLKRKPKDQTGNGNDVLDNIGVATSDYSFYNDKALNIAHNLGTAYAWYDPRSYTENDKVVFDLVKDMSRQQFDIVAKLYHDVYAKGKSLSSDLAKLLDDEYYKLLIIK
ncbi:hypothetical protein A9Q86_02195 [Flavobacteriales bacterium 33_180_T64]|nr:hypothetical protein A9Q86_02195 [Flavobacteriales bacterium 33_180_T64]